MEAAAEDPGGGGAERYGQGARSLQDPRPLRWRAAQPVDFVLPLYGRCGKACTGTGRGRGAVRLTRGRGRGPGRRKRRRRKDGTDPRRKERKTLADFLLSFVLSFVFSGLYQRGQGEPLRVACRLVEVRADGGRDRTAYNLIMT